MRIGSAVSSTGPVAVRIYHQWLHQIEWSIDLHNSKIDQVESAPTIRFLDFLDILVTRPLVDTSSCSHHNNELLQKLGLGGALINFDTAQPN